MRAHNMTANETIKNLLTKDISSKGISKEAAKSIMDAIYTTQQDNELKIEINHIKETMVTKADLIEFKTEVKTNMNWIKLLLSVLIGLAIKIAFFSK